MAGVLCVRCHINEQTPHHHYCRSCKKISDRKSYLKHREKRLAGCRDYVLANKPLVKARNLVYRQSHRIEAIIRADTWNKENMPVHKTHQRNSAWKKGGILNSDGSPFTCVDYDRPYQIQQGR